MRAKIKFKACPGCDGTGTVKLCPRCETEMVLMAGFWPGEDAPAWRCHQCQIEVDISDVDPLSKKFLRKSRGRDTLTPLPDAKLDAE